MPKKSEGASNKELIEGIGSFGSADLESFDISWHSEIERSSWLASDFVLPGVRLWLERVSRSHSLILCSARQNAFHLKDQIKELNLEIFFNEVIASGLGESKALALSRAGILVSPDTWFIGDSPGDVHSARELGMKSCGVLTGFRNRATLERYGADIILRSAADFVVS